MRRLEYGEWTFKVHTSLPEQNTLEITAPQHLEDINHTPRQINQLRKPSLKPIAYSGRFAEV